MIKSHIANHTPQIANHSPDEWLAGEPATLSGKPVTHPSAKLAAEKVCERGGWTGFAEGCV